MKWGKLGSTGSLTRFPLLSNLAPGKEQDGLSLFQQRPDGFHVCGSRLIVEVDFSLLESDTAGTASPVTEDGLDL